MSRCNYSYSQLRSLKTFIFYFLAGTFIVAFQLYVEPSDGGDDDTGLNAARIKCRDLDFQIFEQELWVQGVSYSRASWGPWSEECSLGSAVAAAEMIYEPDLGMLSDDTGAGGIKMYCGGF